MLRLRVEANRSSTALALAPDEVGDLLERRDPELPVERGTARPHVRKPLARPKGSQLVEREVLREPAGQHDAVDHLRRSSIREPRMGGDVGCATDLVLVARDQDAIPCRNHIGLDEIGALLDCQLIARERVLRPVARRATMGDDDRLRRRFDGTGQRSGTGQVISVLSWLTSATSSGLSM